MTDAGAVLRHHGSVRAIPYIDHDASPAERRADRLSSVALALALSPWALCALTYLVFVAGHRPPAFLVGPSWFLGFFMGLTGAFVGRGLRTRRGTLATILGFLAPLVTIVPTALVCVLDMAGWCC